jgi:hypothetical protein
VVMRHDIPNLGTMSEAKPHLITHGFSSRLGKRVSVESLGRGLEAMSRLRHSPLFPRSLISSDTCSLCPKMIVTESSHLQTRMTTSHSGGSMG